MKIQRDKKLDMAYIQLRRGRVTQTVELRPGLIFDFDKNGEVIGVEVLSLKKLAPFLTYKKLKAARRVGCSDL